MFTSRLVLYVLTAAVIAAGLGEFRRRAVEKALLEASIGRLEQQRDLHARYADSLTRTIKVRERDFNSQSEKYERLRDVLRASRATSGPGETLGDEYEVDEVEKVLEAADHTIRSCQSLVRDCTLAISAKDRVIAAQDSTIRAIKALQPSKTRQFLGTVVKVGIGVGAGYIIGRTF